MAFLFFIYFVSIYTLLIDWAYLVPQHKLAFVIESAVFVVILVTVTILFNQYQSFYANGGRKIDLLFLMWLGRELIHTRVKFNRHRRELTELVTEKAVGDAQKLW